MKKSEIQIGATYVAKVSGKLANVRIVRVGTYGGWDGINCATKREIHIRGAARLRKKVDTDRLATIRSLRQGGATFEAARAQVDHEERAIQDAAADIRSKTEISTS